MPMWKQSVVALTLLLIAAVMAVIYVPTAAPFLAGYGFSGVLERFGVAVAAVPREPARGAGGPPGGPVAVVAVPPANIARNDIAEAIGTGRAVRSVILAPEVAGQIAMLAVKPGDFVEEGQLIVALDARAAQIALDRAALTLADTRATAGRLARLQNSGAATELQLQEADLALRTAELALREAEFDLSRRRIAAPIAGWVGFMAAEPGDQVGPGDVLTQIDDRTSLIVEFRLPERVVGTIAAGDRVTAAPLARPEEDLTGTVTALDNRVDEVNRTLRVQAALANPDDRLRAGMAFSIRVQLTGTVHPAVDPLAIQWGRDGAYVWVVRAEKSERLPVTIVQRGSDAVLLRADFLPGDLVVTEGVQNLRPGGEVAVQGSAKAAEG